MPQVIAADSAGIARAAKILQDGGIVAFPTETVYGLGANAFDAQAVARVFEAKRRPEFDPLIVHIAHAGDVTRVADISSIEYRSRQLMDAFWPGALTLVLKKSTNVPGIVTSGLDTVGVRVPSHPVASELISQAGIPVSAPSANPFGSLSPTRAEHVVNALGDVVDLIIDGGSTQFGVESTVVRVTESSVDLLRFGAVTVEELETVVGEITSPVLRQTGEHGLSGPGQLNQHYSPNTRMTIVGEGDPLHGGEDAAYIAFSRRPSEPFAVVEVLSESGQLREAAANLFEALHRVDRSGVSRIYVERVPDQGLGRAVNDRLTRAVAKWK